MLAAEVRIGADYVAATVVLPSAEQALFGLIQADLNDPPTYADGRLSRLLSDALRGLTVDANASAALAERLSAALVADDFILFVSAHVSPNEITVCSAGDYRLHLVEGERVDARRDVNHFHGSHEHVVVDWPREQRGRVFTPALGRDARPHHAREGSFIWRPTTADFSLVACSSLLHRFREPEEYLPAVLARTHRFAWGETLVRVTCEGVPAARCS